MLRLNILKEIIIGDRPQDMIINYHRNHLYTANRFGHNISVIDIIGDSLINNINIDIESTGMGNVPYDLAHNPWLNKMYLTQKFFSCGRGVSIISDETYSIIKNVILENTTTTMKNIIVNPATGNVFISSDVDPVITVIDGKDDQIILTMQNDAITDYFLLNPQNNNIYGVNSTSGGLTIIKDESDFIPRLAVSETELLFSEDTLEKSFNINNIGSDTLKWFIREYPPINWIKSVEPSSGYDNQEITIQIDTTYIDTNDCQIYLRIFSNAGEAFITIKYISNIVEVAEENKSIPTNYLLFQNYPNPFNPVTTIEYAIPKKSGVTITVYNLVGQIVDILVNQTMEPGYYTVQWDASKVGSGIYFYRIVADGSSDVKKCVIFK